MEREDPVRSGDSASDSLPLDGINTSRCSPLHRIFLYLSLKWGRSLALFALYTAAVASTYGPMFLASAHDLVLTHSARSDLKVTFLTDWSALFVFCISFPMLIVLLVTDESVMSRSLCKVQRDGVLFIPPEVSQAVRRRWETKFLRVNVGWQIVAGVAALVAAIFTVLANSRRASGSWMADGGTGVSATYFVSLWLLYSVIGFFVARCVAIAVFLNAVVSEPSARVVLQPFHPDHCGGLRPVGELGLRNQYTVTILGLNVVVLAAMIFEELPHDVGHIGIIVSAAEAYLIFGPIVFLGPLLPFHRTMAREKDRALEIVTTRLRVEFKRISEQIPLGQFTAAVASFIERLRKLGSSIEKLPVWPFDSKTLTRFASAYLIPVVAAVGEKLFSLFIHEVLGIK